MSTLVLQLEEALSRLNAPERAELEARVLGVLGPPCSTVTPETGAVLAQWNGAFPDYPGDIPDMDHEDMYKNPFAEDPAHHDGA